MKKKTAVETLNYLIDLLLYYLNEFDLAQSPVEEFVLGERTAYIECLEVVQGWRNAHKVGLDFDIEARYPI